VIFYTVAVGHASSLTINVGINTIVRMSKPEMLAWRVTEEVRDACLCLHLQRAGRALARRYDEALRPAGLTNGQFSLLMSLNRERPATMGEIAALLGMDRTTLTAALKPLMRRRLLRSAADKADRRSRRLALTAVGHALLAKALPLWREAQSRTEGVLSGPLGPERLRADLRRVGQELEEV
jgi:DNA-binding MarR family transcriptional regulator